MKKKMVRRRKKMNSLTTMIINIFVVELDLAAMRSKKNHAYSIIIKNITFSKLFHITNLIFQIQVPFNNHYHSINQRTILAKLD